MTLIDDLERLAALQRSGALTDAEFASAKARSIAAEAPGRAGDLGGWLRALRRSRGDRWLGGVCGGLAPMSGVPSWLWRLLFAGLGLCGGCGLMLYLLLWVLVPKEDSVVGAGSGGAFHAS